MKPRTSEPAAAANGIIDRMPMDGRPSSHFQFLICM